MCLIMTANGWRTLSDGKVCDNAGRLQGVYRPMSQQMARAICLVRANHFYDHVSDRQAFDPIRGAFGEVI